MSAGVFCAHLYTIGLSRKVIFTFTSIFNSPIIEVYYRIFSKIDFHIGEFI